MKVWHIYLNGNSRAFAKPTGVIQSGIFFLRGWRPFNEHWWSKPGHGLAALLRRQVLDHGLYIE